MKISKRDKKLKFQKVKKNQNFKKRKKSKFQKENKNFKKKKKKFN